MESGFVVGFDAAGIPRVRAESFAEAGVEARLYVRRRPDTGPLSAWGFEYESVIVEIAEHNS